MTGYIVSKIRAKRKGRPPVDSLPPAANPGNMPACPIPPTPKTRSRFELFKNAIFSIADEMALTVFRTTYSGVLKDNMDYSTGFADARRQAGRAGPDAAGPSRLGADRHGGDHAPLRRRHGAGRRLHHERSLRRRHAPARHLRHEAALPRGRAARLRLHRLPPHRCRRPGRRLECLRLHRDLRRRAAHRADEALRGGQAQQDAS